MAESEDKRLEMLVKKSAPDLLKGLNPAQRNQVLHSLPKVVPLLVEQHRSYSGPTPPHEMLEGYNRAIPNGGDRLFALVESQTRHRQHMETTVVTGQLKESERGQIIAFVLVLVCLGIGTVAFLKGHDTVAGVIFGTTVVGVAITFITGKIAQKKDLAKKSPS